MSALDVRGAEFAERRAVMLERLAEVESVHAEALAGGGPVYRERHRARGRLLARERIELLLDPDTPFLELSPLAVWGSDFTTGETFGPAEAVGMGLVTAAEEALEPILDGLRAGSPQGLAESKALTAGRLRAALDERGADVAAVSARLFASAEAAEGVRAFLERREPSWRS
ncbi:hypothetical protein [Actinacidiphila sp. ITFR-21]|uniref:hypothetical protein n=1 Tax=Actinacidiphila sp. ITFR-21 TaxID=3075199 RepID=UPI0037D9ACD3